MKYLKNVIGVFVAALMTFSGITAAYGWTGNEGGKNSASVYVNGRYVYYSDSDAQPQVINSRVYVPIRSTAAELGLSVDWNSGTRTLTFYRDGNKISHQMGTNAIYINGSPRYYDNSPSITISNRTLMPIRMLGDAVGGSIDWNSETKSVYITTGSAAGTNTAASSLQSYLGNWESTSYTDALDLSGSYPIKMYSINITSIDNGSVKGFFTRKATHFRDSGCQCDFNGALVDGNSFVIYADSTWNGPAVQENPSGVYYTTEAYTVKLSNGRIYIQNEVFSPTGEELTKG